MLNKIAHRIRVWKAARRERKKDKERSPKWQGVRDRFIKDHPECVACGATLELQVHHEMPYHLHPELELDPNNLIVLCMKDNECHLRIGHGNNFRAFNPFVVSDAATARKHPERREAIEKEAKAKRSL